MPYVNVGGKWTEKREGEKEGKRRVGRETLFNVPCIGEQKMR